MQNLTDCMPKTYRPQDVIPAEAGIQLFFDGSPLSARTSFAGVTNLCPAKAGLIMQRLGYLAF